MRFIFLFAIVIVVGRRDYTETLTSDLQADQPLETAMRTALILNSLFLVLTIIGSSCSPVQIKPPLDKVTDPKNEDLISAQANIKIALKSSTGATLLFKAENGQDADTPGDEGRQIPYLVLNRNGVTTPMIERMVRISVQDLQVPPSGLFVKLEIATQHMDPELDRGNTDKIRFWEEKRYLRYSPDTQGRQTADFLVVFRRIFTYHGRAILTPTDYYSYRVSILDSRGNLLLRVEQPYAFLLENQWRVPLPKVKEATPGAAPRELVVYSYDMIPYQSNLRDPETRVPRHDIERYLQTELIPAMVKAFEVQSDLWGLPWYAEWSGYRAEDGPKTMSVALGEHGTWFHGAAPSLGHSMISIRVDGSFIEYDNITEGIMSVFHHELFHNQQRNLSLHLGAQGNVAGKEGAWELISEGTAVLASLVGEPGVQMDSSTMPRSYLKRANSFIGQAGVFDGGLNQNYQNIPYHTSLYWRFIYEQCGGIRRIVEDPSAGMQPIRHVLETLYSGDIADINSSSAAVKALPSIIDVALYETPTCPFHSFQESLVHFARAIYLLRRAEGRCPSPHPYASCGFYDPGKLYSVPDADRYILFEGRQNDIDGAIPFNFGLDLLELSLDPDIDGKSLKFMFESTSGPVYDYQVEIWGRRRQSTEDAGNEQPAFEGPIFSERTCEGSLVLEIQKLDLEQMQGLDLVITRLDTQDSTPNSGRYHIQVIVR
jgi:hypothetical protein